MIGSIMVVVSRPKVRVRHSSSTRRRHWVTSEMSFGYGARAADVVHGASRRMPYAPIEGIGTPSNSLALEAGLPESARWSGGTEGCPPRVGTRRSGAGTHGRRPESRRELSRAAVKGGGGGGGMYRAVATCHCGWGHGSRGPGLGTHGWQKRRHGWVQEV